MSGEQVHVAQGALRGRAENGCVAFRGVPYARPPVGPGRFAPPAPPDAWAGVRPAETSGAASLQVNRENRARVGAIAAAMDPGFQGIMSWPGYTAETYNHDSVSEDCLYLDIWVPEARAGSSLPVYVYYHGGANAVSSGHFDLEDGANLAREERIIVVRPTYRLGALGWVHFGLVDDRLPGAVNLGVQDQMAALRWVHGNVAAFGGDPDNITVGGESCGATAVAHLLTLPEAQPLIRRAIIQSLSPFNLWCNQEPADAAEVAWAYLSLLGINDPADLLTIDPERLLAVHALMIRRWHPDRAVAWRPLGAVDEGPFSAGNPARLLAEAPHPRPDFELLIGFAKDEWQFFRGHSHTASLGTRDDVLAVLRQVFGDEAEALYEAYRHVHPDHPAPGHTLGDVMSFVFFKFSSLLIAGNFAGRGVPTYVYQFSYDLPGFGGYLRAVHTGNTPLIFRNIDDHRLSRWPSFDGVDRGELGRLATAFGSLYGSFIRAGDPGTAWPAYDEKDGTILWFGRSVEARAGLLRAEMEAFRSCGMGDLTELERKLVHNLRSVYPVCASPRRVSQAQDVSTPETKLPDGP